MKEQCGFTLIEVLVAMTIFAIGILAIVNMQLLSAQVNVKSRGMTEAIVALQSRIEILSAANYTSGLLQDGAGANNGAAGLNDVRDNMNNIISDQSDLADPVYELYWNVQDDFPFNNTKTVRVLVRWSERGVWVTFPVDMVKSDGA